VHELYLADLPLDPVFEPLRNDPRLQRLIPAPDRANRGVESASLLIKFARGAHNPDCRRDVLVPPSWATKNLA